MLLVLGAVSIEYIQAKCHVLLIFILVSGCITLRHLIQDYIINMSLYLFAPRSRL